MDKWSIDPTSDCQYPFGIIIPESELRVADWPRYRDRGTIWLPVTKGNSLTVAVFLTRRHGDYKHSLPAAGWQTTLVDALLPDGRRLLVVSGMSQAHVEKQADIEKWRTMARAINDALPTPFENARIVIGAGADEQTRHFVEIAA